MKLKFEWDEEKARTNLKKHSVLMKQQRFSLIPLQ